ncbi:ureidoglycolate lyase [Pelagibacterium xiamenense]|uniref:ureidoglycolate lyase n=1 Tax=Pelagibacterium xiamenense TaxID=2901140 RepID=UPI001E4B6E92|nr:ureidoglycolate lyase [Pelagibacterium xiamenense]MCD7060370.1 ureidoglycolate lyase [Pelagibacterium xiamenense]
MSGDRTVLIEPLTKTGFAPFGQVLTTEGAHHYPINNGMTERYHDLANVALAGENARPLISIFRGRPYALPLTLEMVERHPLGSQAFMPLSPRPFLAIVAPDADGTPAQPRAFLVPSGIGVNIGINVWHGVLTALEAQSDFLVVDRGGDGNNLEEHFFERPYTVRMS